MESLSIFYFAGTLFSVLLVAFIIYYVILHQKKVNQHNMQLKQLELNKQQALLIAVTDGEEKERKRLAEELHDGIGAKLSGLNMSLEYLSEQGITNQNLLREVSLGINETINEIREISQNLKPSSLFSKGLNYTLSEFIFHLNKKGNCEFDLYIEDIEKDMSQDIQLMLYRIISELLNNINKHAEASQASVQVLLTDEGVLQLIAEDNGKGFDLENIKAGIGISNIESRIKVHKGTLNLDTSSKGTTIIIELPLA